MTDLQVTPVGVRVSRGIFFAPLGGWIAHAPEGCLTRLLSSSHSGRDSRLLQRKCTDHSSARPCPARRTADGTQDDVSVRGFFLRSCGGPRCRRRRDSLATGDLQRRSAATDQYFVIIPLAYLALSVVVPVVYSSFRALEAEGRERLVAIGWVESSPSRQRWSSLYSRQRASRPGTYRFLHGGVGLDAYDLRRHGSFLITTAPSKTSKM